MNVFNKLNINRIKLWSYSLILNTIEIKSEFVSFVKNTNKIVVRLNIFIFLRKKKSTRFVQKNIRLHFQ